MTPRGRLRLLHVTPRGPSCGQLPKFPVWRPGDSFTTGRVVSVLGREGRGLINKVPTITQSFENMINKLYMSEKNPVVDIHYIIYLQHFPLMRVKYSFQIFIKLTLWHVIYSFLTYQVKGVFILDGKSSITRY